MAGTIEGGVRASVEEVFGVSEKQRFEAELEFVQGLASPQYLNCKPWHIACDLELCCIGLAPPRMNYITITQKSPMQMNAVRDECCTNNRFGLEARRGKGMNWCLICLLGKQLSGAGLGQNRFFEDPAFVEYLAYLQYWHEPRYAAFLQWALTSNKVVVFGCGLESKECLQNSKSPSSILCL